MTGCSTDKKGKKEFLSADFAD